MMFPRPVYLLPRRLQRYLKEVSIIIIVVLVVVMVKHWLGYQGSYRYSNEESDFYHFYEVPGENKPSVVSDVGWNNVAKDGRRRTLNTSEGLVAVKDMMLVPKNPLPNGANLYKSMESSLSELPPVKGRIDSSPRGLDNFQERVSMRGVPRRKEVRPQNSNCTALPCTEFLSGQDILDFQHCSKISKINEEPSATSCSFRQPNPSLRLVALVSSAGSGVDLLRWFLQELTGLCTGSLQCNTGLRRAGYAGESVRTTAVLGIAVGEVNPLWREVSPLPQGPQEEADDVPSFDSAVYLLRNPFDAILEVWNRQQDNSGTPLINLVGAILSISPPLQLTSKPQFIIANTARIQQH